MTEFERFQSAVDRLLALSTSEQASYLHRRFSGAGPRTDPDALLLAWGVAPRKSGRSSTGGIGVRDGDFATTDTADEAVGR